MNIIEALISGIVQGFTEFLPISSSAHLLILNKLFNNTPELTFDVFLHGASLIAILYYFRKTIYSKAIDLFSRDVNSRQTSFRFWLKILLAGLPAGVVYILFTDAVENIHSFSTITAIFLILFGIPLIFLESIKNRNTYNISDISYGKSVFIGIFQSFALIPGVSRSGSSIIGGLLAGLTKSKAREFAFLISMPIIGASFFIESVKLVTSSEALNTVNWPAMIIGFVSSATTSFIALKILLKIMQNKSLAIFGIYRIILGIVLLIIFGV